MSESNQILASQIDDTLWLRPEGRGTFQSSPAVQEVASAGLSREASSIIVDLEACPGMDSTFMGMLAGLSKQTARKGGRVKIVGAEGKNQASLEELGLSAFLDLGENSPSGINEIRAEMVPVCANAEAGQADHILACHEELCESNPENQKKFKDVLEILRAQVG